MKAILEFNLPEETQEYVDHMNGPKYAIAMEEVTQQVFRPARKHGYPENSEIAQALKAIPDGQGEDLIGLLEQEYHRIIREYLEE